MRKLLLVWYEEGKILNKIGLLTYDNNLYQFKYLNYANNDLQLFSNNGLYSGFLNINETYELNELFPTILNRLPSKNRSDYNILMERYNIKENSDDFEILEKTKGKLNSDNFLFITEEEYDLLKNKITQV